MPMNCRTQLSFTGFLFSPGVIEVGQAAILPSTLRKEQFIAAPRGRSEIK